MSDHPAPQRCGFVSLLGAPNAGKSTLVNELVGAKVSIVTHKVQTTRARLRGLFVKDDTQVVLVDTPGVFAPRRRLDRAMVDAAWAGANDSDFVLLIIDAAKGVDDDVERIFERAGNLAVPIALVLNKIDLIKKDALLVLTAEAHEQAAKHNLTFADTFMISALSGSGVEALRSALVAAMPEGPWLFDGDDISDATLRQTAAEITREKLYLRLHQELPYASTVETTDWQTLKDGSARIEQTIYVERDSQKKIVLGHKGQTIKQISMDARREIAEIADCKVHLFLFVKVRERWGDDPERYREIGLDFPTS